MIQLAIDMHRFNLGQTPYQRVALRGWLFLGAFLLTAIISLTLSYFIWNTYIHTSTPFLKWQDALLALLWFVAFECLGGCVMVARFLFAVRAGHTQGMLMLSGDNTLTVRDLSHKNLLSIFWMINSTFWCFVAVLLGVVPIILLGWTTHLPQPGLAILATSLAALLSLAGLVVSIVSTVFILIGCIGAYSFCRKLGSSQTYQLSGELTLRIDDLVLTIMYPASPESMVELELLEPEDQRNLLSLLYKRWQDAREVWNPELGNEIALALEAFERTTIPA
jgi:hypothetical protein